MSALILWIVIAGLAAAVWLRRLEQRRLLKRAVQSRLEVIRREAEQEWAIAELASMVPVAAGYGSPRPNPGASARIEIGHTQ
jgi:hypothetical protein